MIIDLHIHSVCSDGKFRVEDIFKKAFQLGIGMISITDHDSVDCQEEAKILAKEYGINYIYGLELNVTFSHPDYNNSKPISLDFLGYGYDPENRDLKSKLEDLREHRRKRAELILEKINRELLEEGKEEFTPGGLQEIEASVDGAFGRPHIADYMVKKGVVKARQEAFDKYLIKCNIPKMPLSLEEAYILVKNAGGKLFMAHPNHPRGTSLIKYTENIEIQQNIITESILPFIDGIECWHSAHDQNTVDSYIKYAEKKQLLVSGGSDCHQQPVLMGSVYVPEYVADQFNIQPTDNH
ncbi:MAG: PHP domain-containing protein [Desulfobacteraceae bacterium]|jgi:predicted metal-dependent phosphoesterase TrpH